MSATERVLERLDGVKRNGAGWMACCPAHEDKKGSLSVAEGDDGRVLLKCMAGCQTPDILAAKGLSMADLFGKTNGAGKLGEIVATYPYTDEKGELLYQVVRYSPKDFKQRRSDGNGGWIWSIDKDKAGKPLPTPTRRVLYHLPRVLAAAKAGEKAIVICEGEKDVESLEKIGVVATTNARGASEWRDEYSKQFVGAKLVAIIPDNDKAGRDHARAVAASLARAGVEHRIVELPGLPEKGDVSDWLSNGGTKDALAALVEQAMARPPATEDDANHGSLDDEKEDGPKNLIVWAKDIAPRPTDWLWRRHISRGNLSILFGDPGGGKTHVALDIVARITRGEPWPDESGRAPLGNCLVLSGEDSWHTTLVPRLSYAGADLARVAFLPAVAEYGEGNRRTFCLTADAATLEHNVRACGATAITVDPLTCFLAGSDGNATIDVRVALSLLADVAERTGAAVLCILHPNKNDRGGQSALNRLSGSAAFGAAARSVLGVTSDPDDEDEERKLLLGVKANVGKKAEGIGFRVVSDDPDSAYSKVEWDHDPVTVDADEAFGVRRPDSPSMVRAKDFIRRVLQSGEPYPAAVGIEEADAEGITKKTLERARKKLGVKTFRQGGIGDSGGWYWQLKTGGDDDDD